MKTYEKITIPEKKVERQKSTICDLCWDETYNEWKEEYSAFEAEVRMKEGREYPEGASGEEITYDLCPTCFRERLIPWFKSQGAVGKIREFSY